jgi:hypothetical protein
MGQYVLNHGGIKIGDGLKMPSADAKSPTLLELSEEEAAKMNGPKELWGRKGACLVPVAEFKAELAAADAGAKAKAAVLAEAAKAAPKADAKGGGK